jgi:hypothetical protein
MQRHLRAGLAWLTVMSVGVLVAAIGADLRAQAFGLDGISAEPTLLFIEAVRKELKLTEDQIRKATSVAEEFAQNREQGSAGLRDVVKNGAEQARKRRSLLRELSDAAWSKLKGILSEAQATRLQQLTIRRQGVMALVNPGVHEALKLTDKQKQEFREICQKAMMERPTLRDFLLKNPDSPPEKWWDAVHEVDGRALTRIPEILDPSQRAQWPALFGPPFEFKPADLVPR